MNRGLTSAVALALGLGAGTSAAAEDFTFRIGSGHPPVNTYVRLLTEFFVPEVKARIEERTDHTVNFIEGYGGSIVGNADVLDGVQSGILDFGAYCFCFEPSDLPMQAFQVMLPFGTMSPVESVTLARAVYDQVPYMSEVFEDQYDQKLLSLIADNGYNLVTNFPWETVEDLQGQRIAGAGLNLKWLEYAGVVPVQSTLNDAYTSLQTGVYNGWIMFPSGVVNFKLHEVADFYAITGFGSITWHGMTVNLGLWEELPPEVQEIVLEVAREYETMTGTVNEEDYDRQIAQLRELGSTVVEVPEEVRQAWAQSLAEWPQEIASELDGQGLPASEVLNIALNEAEKLGYTWPLRYVVE